MCPPAGSHPHAHGVRAGPARRTCRLPPARQPDARAPNRVSQTSDSSRAAGAAPGCVLWGATWRGLEPTFRPCNVGCGQGPAAIVPITWRLLMPDRVSLPTAAAGASVTSREKPTTHTGQRPPSGRDLSGREGWMTGQGESHVSPNRTTNQYATQKQHPQHSVTTAHPQESTQCDHSPHTYTV